MLVELQIELAFVLFICCPESHRNGQPVPSGCDFVNIHALQMDLVPIDNDLLSMELAGSFVDLFVNDSKSTLKTVANALLKLEILYGPFPSIQAIGQNAQSITSLMKSMSNESLSVEIDVVCEL